MVVVWCGSMTTVFERGIDMSSSYKFTLVRDDASSPEFCNVTEIIYQLATIFPRISRFVKLYECSIIDNFAGSFSAVACSTKHPSIRPLTSPSIVINTREKFFFFIVVHLTVPASVPSYLNLSTVLYTKNHDSICPDKSLYIICHIISLLYIATGDAKKEGVRLMLEERGIRKGIEVFVHDPMNPSTPERKGIVLRTYPRPSRWLVVKFETGDIEQVEETQITTMFEKNRGVSPF